MLKILKKKSVYWSIIIAAVVIFLLVWNGVTKKTDYSDKYKGFDFSKVEGEGRTDSYSAYLLRNKDAAHPVNDVAVELSNDTVSGEGVKFVPVGDVSNVLRTEEGGYCDIKVDVPEAGMYNICLTYYPEQETSRGVEIQRVLKIKTAADKDKSFDEMDSPFNGADKLMFPRIYTDASEPKKDNRGNEIRPSQKEAPRWETFYIKDELGYVIEPYEFYFSKGENIIHFDSSQEPMLIKDITLTAVKERENYDAYLSKMSAEHGSASQSHSQFVKLDGEKAQYRSSQSLYPLYDRSSAVTEPYSVTTQVLNMIGGENWKMPGQWIEWEFDAPVDGYYEITIKARQNYNRGFVSCRTLYINGEVPFDEVATIKFAFSSDWKMQTLSNEKGEPYKFYMHKGKNSIRLEVTLGEMGDILNRMNDSVFRMNSMYRQILVLTGTNPDENRDYNIATRYPGVVAAMGDEYKVLYKLIDDLVAYTGEKGSQVTACLTLADQLEKFYKDDAKIPKNLVAFKNNVSSLGSAILTLSDAQLDIDYIIVAGSDYKVKKDTANWFQRIFHEIRAFFASFVVDYNAIGNVYEGDIETITVWIFAGRDQSTILKSMIDDTFVPYYHIGVNVDLITADVLLPATVAGTGPDVALGVAGAEPVNYALRGAACDLTQFKGDGLKIKSFEEVASEFADSAFVGYRYGKGVYAIPETQYFNLMFYRTDIFEELGIEPPNTWDDLIMILSTIQKAHMDVGIPSTERKINNVSNPDMNGFYAQLYQRGASLYSEDGSRVMLDTDVAIEAFEAFTMFFTHYNTPRDYNFVDRFRTGEMPLAFADYNNFNTLCVSAPEIRGLWKMAIMPGTYVTDENGNKVDLDGDGEYDINRSVQCWGVCSMILENSKKHDEAWTFMQWWASADIQARYGMELEAVMGESARYATANRKAFDKLAWSADERAMLLEQWDWVVGTPEVPGGYYTTRHIVNAVRRVINNNEDPRETLLDYTRDINEEIHKKRVEFGLDKK